MNHWIFNISIILFCNIFHSSLISQNQYFTVFCSKDASLNPISLGHAFVMTGKGTPFTCSFQNGDGEAFGLYAGRNLNGSCKPDGFSAVKSFIVGELPGCIFNDINKSVSNYFIITCDFNQYLKVHSEIQNWKNKNYELSKQDCISFLEAIAKVFPNIRIPNRSGIENFPNKFILTMKTLNSF